MVRSIMLPLALVAATANATMHNFPTVPCVAMMVVTSPAWKLSHSGKWIVLNSDVMHVFLFLEFVWYTL